MERSTSGNTAGSATFRSSASVPGQLDAGRAAADHVTSSSGSVRPSLRCFQRVHQLVPQGDRVPAGVQAQAVLGRACHAEERGTDPGSDDQVVIAELFAGVQRRDCVG